MAPGVRLSPGGRLASQSWAGRTGPDGSRALPPALVSSPERERRLQAESRTGGTGHSRFQSSAFLLRKCPGVKNAPRKPEGHNALVPAALERSIHLCEDKNVELSPNFS